MENKTLEQIQNEVLELTQKIESVKNNLTELQNNQSDNSQINFEKFMDWVDTYFEDKVNSYEMSREMNRSIDLDDYCEVTLSLDYGTIVVEKEWRDTEDIVSDIIYRVKLDFKNWMREEYKNTMQEQDKKEIENNL